MSHSRSYQLPMLMPCRVQAAARGQNVIGGLLTLTVSWLVLGLSVYPVLENGYGGVPDDRFNFTASKNSFQSSVTRTCFTLSRDNYQNSERGHFNFFH